MIVVLGPGHLRKQMGSLEKCSPLSGWCLKKTKIKLSQKACLVVSNKFYWGPFKNKNALYTWSGSSRVRTLRHDVLNQLESLVTKQNWPVFRNVSALDDTTGPFIFWIIMTFGPVRTLRKDVPNQMAGLMTWNKLTFRYLVILLGPCRSFFWYLWT